MTTALLYELLLESLSVTRLCRVTRGLLGVVEATAFLPLLLLLLLLVLLLPLLLRSLLDLFLLPLLPRT